MTPSCNSEVCRKASLWFCAMKSSVPLTFPPAPRPDYNYYIPVNQIGMPVLQLSGAVTVYC